MGTISTGVKPGILIRNIRIEPCARQGFACEGAADTKNKQTMEGAVVRLLVELSSTV